MVEDIKQSIHTRKQRFFSISDGVHHTSLRSARLSCSEASPASKNQNYFQFRTAEHQLINGHSNKPYSLNKKPINSNQSRMSNLTNMEKEENTQEYHRFRSAKPKPPKLSFPTATDSRLSLPCYSQLTTPTENHYSRFRDSRSPRQKSVGGFDGLTAQPHHKCRTLIYDNEAQRFPVPDNKVFWINTFCDYEPFEYTTKKIQQNRRADPIDPSKIGNFNNLDDKIDRRSFTGTYHIDPTTNRPRNPMGRTGLTGRGRLYYWGPNHAGDPVVTRWVRDENGSIVYRQASPAERPKPVLAFVAIQRQDTKQWALPGGMVDPNEQVCETIKREFQEEAVRDGVDKSYIDELFSNGHKLYEAYVDDPRNTDNAWIETVAVHFHDETGELTKHIHLDAGDGADNVRWCQIDRTLELYACHKDIIKIVVDRLNAYW